MDRSIHKGHRALKHLGQNFLVDNRVINEIIEIMGPISCQTMVEIGPGLGALTQPILERLNYLICIELDRSLSERLECSPCFGKKLEVYHQNVMNFNFTKLAQEKGDKLRVFGNLPYNISTSILFHVLKHLDYVKDVHFMLQKEVAEVLVAQPSNSNYSRLSVIIQYHCSVELMLRVFSGSFKPKPKVDSAFVRLLPLDESYPTVDNTQLLNCVVTRAFNQRRKKLRNSLSSLFSVAELESLNIDPELRAQDISVFKYCKLANWLGQSTQSEMRS